MRRGALDRIIDIEHYVVAGVTDLNEPVMEWRVFKEAVFAEVYSRRGVELYDSATKQRISETITRFRIDYTEADGINAKMRISFEGQVYDIKAVLPDHDRKQDCIIDAVLTDGAVEAQGIEIFVEPVRSAKKGIVYQCFFHIIGGTGPYTVQFGDGSPLPNIPAGLRLVQSDEMVWSLEGFPAEVGSYPVIVSVTDGKGLVATTQPFTLVVS